jgi:DNA helicase HerA-like ATPase
VVLASTKSGKTTGVASMGREYIGKARAVAKNQTQYGPVDGLT